jgi:lysophospholipase L1-like esterase
MPLACRRGELTMPKQPAVAIQDVMPVEPRRSEPPPVTLRDYLAYFSLQRIGKLLFGIVVSLLIGEIGIGLVNPMQEVLQKDVIMPDPNCGFRMVPHYKGVMHMNAVPFTTNSWGLRDREYGAPPVGGLRIYVLGDSMVFGFGVKIEQTFTRLLEPLLQARLGRKVEVVNGGMPGYGTLQELAFFEETIDVVKPDVVLVGVTVLNDVSDNLKFANHDGKRHKPASIFKRAQVWLRQRSQLYLLLRHYRASVSAQEMMQIHAVAPPVEMERGLALTGDALERFAQAARRHGVGFGVLILPTDRQASHARWVQTLAKYRLPSQDYAPDEPDVWLAERARREGIPVLDLLPALGEHQDEALYFNDHWTPRGHAIVAAALADFLQQNALLGPPIISVAGQ